MYYTRSWDDQGPYLARLWSIISRFFNVLLLNGSPNESISSRCYRVIRMQGSDSIQWRIYAWCANKMFFWQENHIKKAYFYNIAFCEEFLDRHYKLMQDAHNRNDREIEDMFPPPLPTLDFYDTQNKK